MPKSGILLHVTSLANPYPIGDLGPAAYKFVDFLKQSGQTYWQMLPVGPTGMENSPYDGSSAFAGNPLLISCELLVLQGLLNKDLLLVDKTEPTYVVDFAYAKSWKLNLLQIAYSNFKTQNAFGTFDEFVKTEAFWLEDYVLYIALSVFFKTSNWTKWDYAFRTRDLSALLEISETLADELQFHRFVQWQFALQMSDLKNYCNECNIQLIGDLPLFVAHQSADVWAHPELFKLDENGLPLVVAGVPPDYFAEFGQMWNVPVYRWDRLKEQDYNWWVKRILQALKRFDLLRLDHFIGFVHIYEIPADALNAVNGIYQPSAGIELFEAIRDKIHSLPFIAEDLGAKTKEVDELRKTLGILGMRVLQFEADTENQEHAKDVVMYTGTHDNDTIEGWYQGLSQDARLNVKHKFANAYSAINWAAIAYVYMQNAEIVIIPMQDILGLKSSARMNIPEVGFGNWRFRLSDGVLDELLAERLHRLCAVSGRV